MARHLSAGRGGWACVSCEVTVCVRVGADLAKLGWVVNQQAVKGCPSHDPQTSVVRSRLAALKSLRADKCVHARRSTASMDCQTCPSSRIIPIMSKCARKSHQQVMDDSSCHPAVCSHAWASTGCGRNAGTIGIGFDIIKSPDVNHVKKKRSP